MNLLLNASIIAGSLFLLNVTEPAKANTVDPISSTAPDSNLLLAAHEGHGGGGHGGGGHGGGGHFGGGHGGNWGGHGGGYGYGYGDVDIGVGVSDDSDDCWIDQYGNQQCNYDD